MRVRGLRVRAGAAALFLFWGAGPGVATPPDIAIVEDEILGFSRETLFLLRKLHDNLGSYYAEERAVFLVEVSRGSGEERLFPIYQLRRVLAATEGEGDQLRDIWSEEVRPVEGGVDPWARIAAAKAMLHMGKDDPALPRLRLERGEDATWAVEGQRVALDPLREAMAARLEPVILAAGDYARPTPLHLEDLLSGIALAPSHCDLLEARQFSSLSGGAEKRVVRMQCRAEADGSSASLILLLPEEALDPAP